jgi:hypothetical protein
MHAQVQQMRAINALDVSNWHRGPQPAENDLTARSTPGQQQEMDSKRAAPESPTVHARCLASRSLGGPSRRMPHISLRWNQSLTYARPELHKLERAGFRVSLR